MAISWTWKMRAAGMAASLTVAFSTSACQLVDLVERDCLDGACSSSDGACADKSKVCTKPTIRALAGDLDDLEGHIEKYGSVVAQQPSVWGQARLTKHREEFEQQMLGQLDKFQVTLQGSLSQSDQAYAADALALSFTAQAAASKSPGGGGAAPASSASSSSSSAAAPKTAVPLPSELENTFDAFSQTNFTRNAARLPAALGFATIGKGGVSLEPTIQLDQMKRYLDHLHEIRRINEGDDTADSPGYSLNLVRIPISVLPGHKTEKGFGAEITVTLKPHLHDELLPMTFRNLVLNDLIEQLGVPITHVVNDPSGQAYLDELANGELEHLKDSKTTSAAEAKEFVKNRLANAPTRTLMQRLLSYYASPDYKQIYEDYVDEMKRPSINYTELVSSPRRRALRAFPSDHLAEIYGMSEYVALASRIYEASGNDAPNRDITHYADVQSYLHGHLGAAQRFLETKEGEALWRDFCRPELVALIRNRNVDAITHWRHCFETRCLTISGVPSDAPACEPFSRAPVHEKNPPGRRLLPLGQRPLTDPNKDPKQEKDLLNLDITIILAWGIIVDSALLNDHLMHDMIECAEANNCPALKGLTTEINAPPHGVNNGNCPDLIWQQFYLPCPPQKERDLFNEYVKCRWPIHVFALDPETEQQNIANSYSSRREMQLAMSLAFVSGQMSANNMMRYARRLETEMETIALNNTIVGFSHGSESFGWRIYPRFQTPDTESNATVFFRDLLIGGPNKNAYLRQRRLEPGIRECVAIVLMPSFVPFAEMDASSNWFGLANPHRKKMDSTDAVKLSERVKSIQNCAQNVTDTECYRDGERERLLHRADQLAARLPLQTMSVQVPYENTLGGFAMFSTGVTDLAPELLGWYGTPAINLDAPTTLFLIGDHFSVHRTRVIAGGQEVSGTEMLSRQVMKVTIPPNGLALVQETGIVAGGWDPSKATKTIQMKTVVAPAKPPAAAAAQLARFRKKTETQPDGSAAALDNPPPLAEPPTPGAAKEPVSEKVGPDYLFVDVQLSTPYGATSHLLVPAWHLGKTGAGSAAGPDSGGDGKDSGSPGVASWTTSDLTLGFVYRGLGIAPSQPPTYRPKELTIDLQTLPMLQDGDQVTLKMKLGGPTAQLPNLTVTIATSAATGNYDAKKKVLKIAGTDLGNLVAYLFNELQYAYGPEANNPVKSVTIAETTITVPRSPDTKLRNALNIGWVKTTSATPPPASTP
jgi:hypothetical protein